MKKAFGWHKVNILEVSLGKRDTIWHPFTAILILGTTARFVALCSYEI